MNYNLASERLQKILSKYEKFGYKTFYKALSESTKELESILDLMPIQSWIGFVDSNVNQEIIEQYYIDYYSQVSKNLVIENLKVMIALFPLQKDIIEDFNIGFRSKEIIDQTSNIGKSTAIADKVTKVNNYTKQLIKDAITDGLEKNLTKEQIARNIKKITNGQIAKMRALRIARTETTLVNSLSTTALSSGIQFKQQKKWLPRLDGREREWHGAMNSKNPIPKEQFFDVGGERMEYPGDQRASAANVVNCRCSIVYIPIKGTYQGTDEGSTNIGSYLRKLLKSLLTFEFFN